MTLIPYRLCDIAYMIYGLTTYLELTHQGITQRHFWKQNPDKNFLNDFFFNLFQTKGALTVHFDPERPPSFDLIGGLFFDLWIVYFRR